MKVNLGAGEKPSEGWLNVDIRHPVGYGRVEGGDIVGERGPVDLKRFPWVVADAAHLPFKDGSIESILASDLIEHFKRSDTVSVLTEWHRVLKTGGELRLKTPNMRTLAQTYLGGDIPMEEFARKTYGGQEYPGNFHFAGFDPNLLERLLRESGFSMVKVTPRLDGADWSNMGARATK